MRFAERAPAPAPRAEALLWQELGAGRMLGRSFERAYPLARSTLDFYCEALGLAIEIGAILHETKSLRGEQRRSARLARLGIAVLRFSDEEVVHNLDGVLAAIRRFVRMRAPRTAGAGPPPRMPAPVVPVSARAASSRLRRNDRPRSAGRAARARPQGARARRARR